jgi:branched-subunit amino acid aminotransferase/4-amino-4-deoxychorismate lyase
LREAVRRGAGEALWFNIHNYLQSASIANVFIVKDKTLITPPTNEDLRDPAIAAACPYPKSNVLPGVTRGAILDLARANNIPTRIEALNVNNVLEAEELFLTNCIMQIMPVGRIEKHKVSEETPGPITQMLITLFQEELAK